MNYAVKYYKLQSNPCKAAGAMGKSRADEMNIWTQEEFEHFITFENKIAYREGDEYFLTPKTEKGTRNVTIPQSLYDELYEYAHGVCMENTERIFYFQKSGLTSEFKRIIEKSGLPPIRIHDLRHSHASMLIHMNIEIKEIADRLGHESPQTTWETYAHLYPGQDQVLAGKLLNDFSGTDNADITYEQLLMIYDKKPADEISKLEQMLSIYRQYADGQSE